MPRCQAHAVQPARSLRHALLRTGPCTDNIGGGPLILQGPAEVIELWFHPPAVSLTLTPAYEPQSSVPKSVLNTKSRMCRSALPADPVPKVMQAQLHAGALPSDSPTLLLKLDCCPDSATAPCVPDHILQLTATERQCCATQ